MAHDLPQTIDDLTDAEFRALMKKQMLCPRIRQSDLLWHRYQSLAEEAQRLEAKESEAWTAWMAAVGSVSRAHDEAMRIARDRPAAYTRACRAYRAAQDTRDKAEAARDRTNRAAMRMRKRADAVYAALEKLRPEQAEG